MFDVDDSHQGLIAEIIHIHEETEKVITLVVSYFIH
jgi:hypothetical protein